MNENHGLKKMREGYGDAVIDLAKNDEKVVFVGADCGGHERRVLQRIIIRYEWLDIMQEYGVLEDVRTTV